MPKTPAPDQLDIFTDSRDVMLRNDVIEALERRDAGAAREAWHALTAVSANDAAAAPMRCLIEALDQPQQARLDDCTEVASQRQALAQVLTPAARQVLGVSAAEAWLRPAWAALAQRCEHLPFDARQAEDHAAALWLRATDWRRGRQAAERIASWRRIPAPLAWVIEARYRDEGLDAVWPLMAELAWLAPARALALNARLQDERLLRLQRRFEAAFEDAAGSADLAWFPAWLLTQTPALAVLLGQAQPGMNGPPERGMRLLLALLELERQGRHHDLIQRRRALRDLNDTLYAAYMATR